MKGPKILDHDDCGPMRGLGENRVSELISDEMSARDSDFSCLTVGNGGAPITMTEESSPEVSHKSPF